MEKKTVPLELKKELMLQINQRLFDQGILPKAMYEETKIRIVALHS